jgi:hypothetical protein
VLLLKRMTSSAAAAADVRATVPLASRGAIVTLLQQAIPDFHAKVVLCCSELEPVQFVADAQVRSSAWRLHPMHHSTQGYNAL